jgi:glycosyltransferase involved in cell wall biosynthesis
MSAGGKSRVLVFIVAYNAQTTISDVLTRIPKELSCKYDVEILVIDDASQDGTFETSETARSGGLLPFPLHVLFNPVNQGYGGNQKIGYHYAINNGFDFVALVHGDGQYAPECLPTLLEPLSQMRADAVFGSRMIQKGAALKGGMPMYKWLGNKVLSWFENRMLRTSLSEFHSGYRIYSIESLKKIPFDLNTNNFHFDTEVIVQLVLAGLRIKEVPIPTYYGDELCRVNGLEYAWNCAKAVTKARLQELGFFYDRRFDCATRHYGNAHYTMKADFESPHTVALAKVRPGTRVLDLGCAGGYMGELLQERSGCRVTGVDMFPLGPTVHLFKFVLQNLNEGPPCSVEFEDLDYVLMLDVVEHLSSPESFVDELRDKMKFARNTELIVSTGNIAFAITRFMLLVGQFNYGKRGILDITHTRLFTFASLRRLFEQGGFEVIETRGIAAPFPMAMNSKSLGRLLVRLNRLLIRLWRSMFSYQIMMVLRPRPSLEYLLETAQHQSAARILAAKAHRTLETEPPIDHST